ncbi:serine hydroxymethyltransferase [Rickettsiella grylli]|uniref:Serine hydroxymethyltransferase n=1 Tax=Rickettsiella grylli TaxID=59196 RepID=A8PKN3_9COXI|nr:serine hydroxymethyltransferase [Rickettsiella grylli]EDP46702.1 serine hydroxymethyltransferase [Rickettsiella grylli]
MDKHLLNINKLLELLLEHEKYTKQTISLVPSENVLSPLARIPYLLDNQSRYFLDDLRLFGKWVFPSGQHLASIEQTILKPLLIELAKAKYINVRPISGINCMTVTLAALTKRGDSILTVPLTCGGHPSSSVVAERLALKVNDIPMSNCHEINYIAFEDILKKVKPSLVYIDQATFLFPISVKKMREIIDIVSPSTIIHYDSSHINGLIFGGVCNNPLDEGAHCFGGSTHKTFPGPHKGFLATNDPILSKKIESATDHFVSHHHAASVISLAITLIEFKFCKGKKYAENIVINTRYMGELLNKFGYHVVKHGKKYTECHQLWVAFESEKEACILFSKLCEAGLYLNYFQELPGIHSPGFRLSLSEFTRYGASMNDVEELCQAFIAIDNEALDVGKSKIRKIRQLRNQPNFCFKFESLPNGQISEFLRTYINATSAEAFIYDIC